jgi:hypothetical protein
MEVQCCVCKKFRNGGRWVSLQKKDLPSRGISHGYCPKCADVAFAEIRNTQSRIKLTANS